MLMENLSEFSEDELFNMVSTMNEVTERKLNLYYCQLEHMYTMIIR